MTKRAAPRKSTLAGTTPVTAASQPAPTSEPVDPPSPGTPPTLPQDTPVPGKKTKIAYYQNMDLAARIRGAYQATAHLEGHRSFSDFHAAVLEKELNRLEAKYNHGQPYQGAAPKSGRLGRPLD
jgi:hypothetical protein